MGLGLRYKNEEQIFQEQYTEPPYLEYPMFRETGIVKHGFSTRIGGVSGSKKTGTGKNQCRGRISRRNYKKRKHQSNRKTHQRSDYCTVQG